MVSESAPRWKAQAKDFPRRNRIISGLSRAVVVVEAEARSGSLITARLAAEQGREVLAVPGSPLDPRAKGTNDLIRQGAALCEGVEDVLRTLEGFSGLREPPRGYSPPPPDLGDDDPAAQALRARVRALLSPTPVARDEIVRAARARPPSPRRWSSWPWRARPSSCLAAGWSRRRHGRPADASSTKVIRCAVDRGPSPPHLSRPLVSGAPPAERL